MTYDINTSAGIKSVIHVPVDAMDPLPIGQKINFMADENLEYHPWGPKHLEGLIGPSDEVKFIEFENGSKMVMTETSHGITANFTPPPYSYAETILRDQLDMMVKNIITQMVGRDLTKEELDQIELTVAGIEGWALIYQRVPIGQINLEFGADSLPSGFKFEPYL